jgi:hypothetical protein
VLQEQSFGQGYYLSRVAINYPSSYWCAVPEITTSFVDFLTAVDGRSQSFEVYALALRWILLERETEFSVSSSNPVFWYEVAKDTVLFLEPEI